MYAVPHAVRITHRSAADASLDQVVPQVSGLPGFVAGYGVARSANQGLALIVFDSKEAAQAELQRRGHAPSPSGTPESHGILEWWRESEAHGEVADAS